MTEPLTVLAVDDEVPNLDELAYLLAQDDRVGTVLTASSGPEALKLLRECDVDVVFLDIEMPGLDGLELAGVVAMFTAPPAVVFVTAHTEHAVEAFDLHAVDYVLKPVRPERLREAVRRVVRPDPSPPSQQHDEQIAVELGGVTRLINRSAIRYIEAEGDYCRLHTDQASHLVRVPISSLEQRWPDHFLRIHRSYLVGLAHIDHIKESDGRVHVVIDGIPIPVSRRHTPDLREQLRRTRRGGDAH